ncbi:response regulator [Clostridium felsineum]|uniref:response regulator n=1 Tax=Clostridium felsineum TaxID=36839 RepID=UPI00214DAB69|nr:response regulator [Clostridium felsineum]MCR3758970.1 response regulator [Clostridium felsineum]
MGKRVLIVDDAAFVRRTLRMMLEANGFEIVDEAENGLIGLSKYKEHSPDIVTMDITMEGMNGIEALKAILKYNPKAKVVMVTAMGQESMVKKAIISGAKSFIVKPFKQEQLIETMEKVLAI